jgi:hypothetical protein
MPSNCSPPSWLPDYEKLSLAEKWLVYQQIVKHAGLFTDDGERERKVKVKQAGKQGSDSVVSSR